MSTEPIFLIGGGGHSSVVLDALLGADPGARVRILDQDPELEGSAIAGFPVECSTNFAEVGEQLFHVAIGNNMVRERVFRQLQEAGGNPATIIHPAAVVAVSAQVGSGSFLAATSLIAPGAQLAEGCIVNHGATVDHDCDIGTFCHVGPNASLAGDVRIGARTLIGMGAVVLPGISLGADICVGAGAVVQQSWTKPGVLVGVPAAFRRSPS